MPAILHNSGPMPDAPVIHLPVSPIHSPRAQDNKAVSFHVLFNSALDIHEKLHTRSLRLEAENKLLQAEILHMKQGMSLLDMTPRPSTHPAPLTPRTSETTEKRVRISDHADEISGFAQSYVSEVSEHSPPVEPSSSSRCIAASESGIGLQPCSRSRSRNPSVYSYLSTSTALSRQVTGQSSSTVHKQLTSKKITEIRRKFKKLDCDGQGRITSQQLDEMLAKDWKKRNARQSKSYCSSAESSEPTCSDVIIAVNTHLGSEETAMTCATFVSIMTMEDVLDSFEPGICDKIYQIRQMLARDEMNKMVARFSHLATHEFTGLSSMTDTRWVGKYIDPVSLIAILLNAILLGISTDLYPLWKGWDIIEYFFTAFFLLELLLKGKIDGVDKCLFGSDSMWNYLDAVVVFVALMDAIVNILASSESSNIQLFMMLRLLRLARVTRLVRLLRFKFFKELLLMVHGVFAGMRVLLWAIVLLTMYVFMCGMVMRQTIGRWCNPENLSENLDLCAHDQLQQYGGQLFSTVVRSCLTVFRCFTEDCVAPNGTPLVVHIYEINEYGPVIVLIYVISFLFVTFGLFNLIMAIFVENTMESAKYDDRKRQQLRQMQAVHVAQKLQRLVMKFCQASSPLATLEPSQGSGRFRDLLARLRGRRKEDADEANLVPVGMDTEISRDTFSKVVADPHVEQLLDDLEVAVSDPMDLFDTLDADGSGSIDVSELINGIMRLRGTAEKSDVIACLLVVRAMQKSVLGLESKLTQMQKMMRTGQEQVSLQVRQLDSSLHLASPRDRDYLRTAEASKQFSHGLCHTLTT